MPERRYMDFVIGKSSSLATNKPLPPSNGRDMASVSSVTMDNVHQRLFVSDSIRVSRHEVRNRLLVFDVHPDRLTDYPEAVAVLGQPDFKTNEPGTGPRRFGGSVRSALDEENQWLFAVDGSNNRVLVFDVDPERFENGPAAIAVLGQRDFESRAPGAGRTGLARPAFVAFDSGYRRLFVTDAGNQRILVYDVPRTGIANGQAAIAVLGQPDFESRGPRTDPRKAGPGDISIEPDTQRLLVSEIGNNRILVFDVHPERLKNNPDAINVIGQPDFQYADFDPIVARNTTRSPHHVAVDSENQLIYMVDGFSGRNGVTIFDIHPDRLTNQPDAVDVLGKLDDAGEPDFERRAAQDSINGRFNAEIRSLALDPVDHRLIAGDQYNHRVVIWQLDEENRIADRTAEWVIGQPDLDSSYLRKRSRRHLKKPYALAYDHRHKRLFIAETLSDRVTVWDLHPDRMQNYPEAVAVIGQEDFTTRLPQRTRRGLFLGDSMGHGIGSGGPRPTGLAMDVDSQRLFVADGANHRVMIYDVDPERLENRPQAIAVLGQPDFTSGVGPAPGAASVDSSALTVAAQGGGALGAAPEPSADRLYWPAALDYDARHGRLFVADGYNHRVLVFEADPARLRSGAAAIAVIGQPDFSSKSPGLSRSSFQWPDGVAYDSVNDHLYVTDMGNDRVLVFDVAPERLENGPEAVAVLGQTDFESWSAGPEQHRLSDPRDVEFDSANQRLFVADSYQTRIQVFDMPVTARKAAVPPQGSKRYSTLDWKDASRTESYASLAAADNAADVAAFSLLDFSDRVMDPVSKRESRVMRSEAAVVTPKPSRSASFLAARNESIRLVLSNPGNERARVTLTWASLSGEADAERTALEVPGGALAVHDAAHPGASASAGPSLLRLESDVALGLYALTFSGAHGSGPVVSPTPAAMPDAVSNGSLVIPRLEVGGTYRSEVVLMNPSDETMRGQISIVGLGGGEHVERYEIAPGGAYLWSSGQRAGLSRTAYATVTAAGDAAPVGGARVSRYDADRLLSRAYVMARAVSNRAWIPVDTYASPTRHGRIRTDLTVVNDGANPPAGANLRINVFTPDGVLAKRYEQNLPVGEQWEVTLAELSRTDRFRGSVRVVSDVPVAVSATQAVENVERTPIEVELPVFDGGHRPEHGSLLMLDGEGVATELVLVNRGRAPFDGELAFHDAEGRPRRMILR